MGSEVQPFRQRSSAQSRDSFLDGPWIDVSQDQTAIETSERVLLDLNIGAHEKHEFSPETKGQEACHHGRGVTLNKSFDQSFTLTRRAPHKRFHGALLSATIAQSSAFDRRRERLGPA